MSRPSRKQFLRAERAAAAALMERVPEAHFIERMSLESRIESLDEELQALGGPTDEVAEPVSTTVFFDGGPVVAERGIDAVFASQAITHFQGLVEKVGAVRRHGGLAKGGMVPDSRDFRLHITDVARGSFGFHFEQFEGNESSAEVKQAVDEASSLLEGLLANDEDFYERMAELEPRVFGELKEFVDVLSSSEATLRVESRGKKLALNKQQVHDASRRLSAGAPTFTDEERRVEGFSFLLNSRRFEMFDPAKQELLKGRLAPDLDANMLAEFAALVMQPCIAKIRITRVERPGMEPKVTYSLLWVRPIVRPALPTP